MCAEKTLGIALMRYNTQVPKPYEQERRRRARERRGPYEFSDPVKNAVWKRAGGYCEECHIRKGSEYHHVKPIAEAIEFGYNPTYISSAENCLLVCQHCHSQLDAKQ